MMRGGEEESILDAGRRRSVQIAHEERRGGANENR
jgi:hypothetical protein